MFQRILIAVDGSEPSAWAVEAGISLAASVDGRVALVHVVDTADAVAAAPASSSDTGVIRLLRREGPTVLRKAQERIPATLRSRVDKVFLREGRAPDEILSAAREWRADLVVVGPHGRARLAHFLLGATADAVARQAHCPVLIASYPSGAPNSVVAGTTAAHSNNGN